MFFRIGTRGSKLALRQAQIVAEALSRTHATGETPLKFEICPIQTRGDLQQNRPILELGGRGIFSKEIEQQLIAGDIDIAVHSFKDMPTQSPPELCIAALLPREDPRDALLSPHFTDISELPQGAKIGTSSLRRQLFIRQQRPDLYFTDIRGNIDSRIEKMSAQGYAGIILAVAGLNRLGLNSHIRQKFSIDACIPAAGQGIIAVQCRRNDPITLRLLKAMHNPITGICGGSERVLMNYVEGSCKIPFAAYAELDFSHNRLILTAMLARPHDETKPAMPQLNPDLYDAEIQGIKYKYQRVTHYCPLSTHDIAIIAGESTQDFSPASDQPKNTTQLTNFSTTDASANHSLTLAPSGNNMLFDLVFPIGSGLELAATVARSLGCREI